MEIFNIPTDEQIKALIVLDKTNEKSKSLYNLIKGEANRIMREFFAENPILQVQLMGTGAVEMFAKHQAIQNLLQFIDPTYVPKLLPEGYSFTPNADGSGILTYTEPEETVENIVEEPTN